MKSLSRLAFGIGAAALIAGCGGSQPPIGTPGSIPQSAEHPRNKTLGLQNDRGSDLIYVEGPQDTYILSYADGSVVTSFKQSDGYAGLCSDARGNVFMPAPNEILEYAHGGTKPIAQLGDGNNEPLGCSVDPTSGDLAVANNFSGSHGPGNIAIYKNASGNPTFFSDGRLKNYISCGFDDSGNLFLDGISPSHSYVFAELPKGSNGFQLFSLSKPITNPGSVQWDGRYVAMAAFDARLIYRIKVSGSSATIVGTVHLFTKKGRPDDTFWLQGNTLLTAAGPHDGSVGLFKYPRGRKEYATYPVLNKGQLGGMTVSIGASR